jgi:hypothetical protein
MPTYDRVTSILEKFGDANLGKVAKYCKSIINSATPFQIPSEMSLPKELASLYIKRRSVYVAEHMKEICLRNNAFRIVILMRKIPVQVVIYGLLSAVKFPLNVAASAFTEGVLHATNLALKYSSNPLNLSSGNDRNHILPTDDEMWDAMVLIALATAWRIDLYALNTVARIPGHQDIDQAWPNIHNFSKRTGAQNLISIAHETEELQYTIVLSSTLCMKSPLIQIDSILPFTVSAIRLVNYVPVQISTYKIAEYLSSLSESEVFDKIFGLSYDVVINCWHVLQIIGMAGIPSVGGDAKCIIKNKKDALKLERLFDTSETGLATANFDDLAKNCISFLKLIPGDKSPTAEQWEIFLTAITTTTWVEYPEVIESHKILYRFGKDAILWDFLRQGGFWRSILRAASKNAGKSGQIIGEKFEAKVIEKLRALNLVTVESNVKIRIYKKIVMEIDGFFILHGVLFLLEVKGWTKSDAFLLANDKTVRDRTARILSVINDRDNRLKENIAHFRKRWPDVSIKSAVSILVTREPEYIGNSDPIYWLDRKNNLPRACTTDELCWFISNATSDSVADIQAKIDLGSIG